MTDYRVGIGIDAHKFIEGRPLILGGVLIKYPFGLAGHSDADVLTHAIIDALLGAAGEGDIGTLFPDSDEAYRNIDSMILLKKASEGLFARGWKISNIDSVIICQKPHISEYISEMKKRYSEILEGLSAVRIGIKGTTTENMGFTGRQEGIAAQAVAMIYKD